MSNEKNISHKMMKLIVATLSVLASVTTGLAFAQQSIPFDTERWEIDAKAYVLENYQGKDAIYIQQGSAKLKNTAFRNGTLEFD